MPFVVLSNPFELPACLLPKGSIAALLFCSLFPSILESRICGGLCSNSLWQKDKATLSEGGSDNYRYSKRIRT